MNQGAMAGEASDRTRKDRGGNTVGGAQPGSGDRQRDGRAGQARGRQEAPNAAARRPRAGAAVIVAGGVAALAIGAVLAGVLDGAPVTPAGVQALVAGDTAGTLSQGGGPARLDGHAVGRSLPATGPGTAAAASGRTSSGNGASPGGSSAAGVVDGSGAVAPAGGGQAGNGLSGAGRSAASGQPAAPTSLSSAGGPLGSTVSAGARAAGASAAALAQQATSALAGACVAPSTVTSATGTSLAPGSAAAGTATTSALGALSGGVLPGSAGAARGATGTGRATASNLSLTALGAQVRTGPTGLTACAG